MSVSTVSRVLNKHGNRFAIAPKTVERVESAARELGYRPNRLARAIAYQRTNLIGLSIPHYSSDTAHVAPTETSVFNAQILGDLIGGVLDNPDMSEFDLVIHDRRKAPDENNRSNMLQPDLLDGSIYANPTVESIAFLKELPEDFPVVLLGESEELRRRLTTVDIDNRASAKTCVRHLIDIGRRNILILVPRDLGHVLCIRDRLAGFDEAMREAGLEPSERDRVELRNDVESVAAFVRGFEDWCRYDAVIAPEDAMAVFCLQALQQRGVRVPDEIAVAGFGNSLQAKHASPPLTSMRVPFHEMAYRAASLLVEQILNGGVRAPGEVRVESELCVRGSTVRDAAE